MADNNTDQTTKSDEPISPQKLGIIFVAAILLCALIIWGIVSLRATSPNSSAAAVAMATSATTTSTGQFSVTTQAAGRSVLVTNIVASSSVWLVVYDNIAGKPGNTLGAALVSPGQQTLRIPLLRATMSGKTYFVGESRRNKGSRVYSRTSPVMLPALMSFTAK